MGRIVVSLGESTPPRLNTSPPTMATGLRVNVAETAPDRFGRVDLAVVAIAFAAIFVVELPDKTFVAALVLSTRYRPLAVWVGVGLAFLIQTLIACTVGGLVTVELSRHSHSAPDVAKRAIEALRAAERAATT